MKTLLLTIGVAACLSFGDRAQTPSSGAGSGISITTVAGLASVSGKGVTSATNFGDDGGGYPHEP
jgi:hypothetical protein